MKRPRLKKLFETPRSVPTPYTPTLLAADIALAKRIAVIKAQVIREAAPKPPPPPSPIVEQQILVHKWKLANADEGNDMEALPPITVTLVERPAMLNGIGARFEPEKVWFIVSYGPFAVRIQRNPVRLTGPHEIQLITRPDLDQPAPLTIIAKAYTEEFVFTKKERALEQYFRVLCNDIF